MKKTIITLALLCSSMYSLFCSDLNNDFMKTKLNLLKIKSAYEHLNMNYEQSHKKFSLDNFDSNIIGWDYIMSGAKITMDLYDYLKQTNIYEKNNFQIYSSLDSNNLKLYLKLNNNFRIYVRSDKFGIFFSSKF